MTTEDIVVVGGGLGGLIAAKTLAENGISPLLLEREKDLCQKACGEIVAKDAYGFSINDFLDNPDVIERRFDRLIINFYGKDYVTIPQKGKKKGFPPEIVSINKKKFHNYLLEKAKKKGARILMGEAVSELKRKNDFIIINGKIKTKLLIGADGFHSKVREFAGLKKPKGIFALSAYALTDYRYPYVFFDPKIIPSGLAWIFPKKGMSNIGIGGFNKEEVRLSWLKFTKKMDIKPKNLRGAFIPASLPTKTYFDNIMLIGDAASQIDLFWGAGINSTLVAGYLAAQVAKKAIGNNRNDAPFLKKYEKLWKKYMYRDLLRSYFYQKIFYSFLINHKKETSLLLLFKYPQNIKLI